jgi:hypothetical protein
MVSPGKTGLSSVTVMVKTRMGVIIKTGPME